MLTMWALKSFTIYSHTHHTLFWKQNIMAKPSDTLNRIAELARNANLFDEVKKAESGNKAAATRARKTLQTIKELAQQGRGELLECSKSK